ncbi:MAG: HD domain-containing phosphohydrolase [Candidatus Dormibacteria bacterium]
MKARFFGRGVGRKVILPFVVLSMVGGLASSGLVGMQLASAARAEIDAQAIREQDSVASSFGAFEQRQLTDLRTMAATQGVGAAMASGDVATLQQLLLPAVTVQLPDPLRTTALSAGGKELLSVRAVAGHVGDCTCTAGRDLSRWPHVADVLAGKSDQYGSKYIGVMKDADGQVLMYTVGPVVRDGQVVGAMMVGEPLLPLLADVKARTGFAFAINSASGQTLASNTSIPATVGISTAERRAILTHPDFVHKVMPGSGGGEVFFVPWKLRHDTVGYAAVVVPASALAANSVNIPALLVGVFAIVFVLTLGTGIFVARLLTRPLNNLVQATREVAGGNLDYQAPVTTTDEIGTLTGSFNSMTQQLKQQLNLLEESAEATVQTLASAIDARDAYTHGHSLRVTEYSMVMARAAGFSSQQIDVLRRGGLVHDIGKIGVADAILQKAGPLDAGERTAMQAHAAVGEQMLRHLNWDRDVLDIVRHHHERYDGMGYPDRLAGPEIPALARLVAVADTLDAMTSDRPYRRGFDFQPAADEIEGKAGTQFDPSFVAVFIACRERLEQMMLTYRGAPVGTADVPSPGEPVSLTVLDSLIAPEPAGTMAQAPKELKWAQ